MNQNDKLFLACLDEKNPSHDTIIKSINNAIVHLNTNIFKSENWSPSQCGEWLVKLQQRGHIALYLDQLSIYALSKPVFAFLYMFDTLMRQMQLSQVLALHWCATDDRRSNVRHSVSLAVLMHKCGALDLQMEHCMFPAQQATCFLLHAIATVLAHDIAQQPNATAAQMRHQPAISDLDTSRLEQAFMDFDFVRFFKCAQNSDFRAKHKKSIESRVLSLMGDNNGTNNAKKVLLDWIQKNWRDAHDSVANQCDVFVRDNKRLLGNKWLRMLLYSELNDNCILRLFPQVSDNTLAHMVRENYVDVVHCAQLFGKLSVLGRFMRLIDAQSNCPGAGAELVCYYAENNLCMKPECKTKALLLALDSCPRLQSVHPVIGYRAEMTACRQSSQFHFDDYAVDVCHLAPTVRSIAPNRTEVANKLKRNCVLLHKFLLEAEQQEFQDLYFEVAQLCASGDDNVRRCAIGSLFVKLRKDFVSSEIANIAAQQQQQRQQQAEQKFKSSSAKQSSENSDESNAIATQNHTAKNSVVRTKVDKVVSQAQPIEPEEVIVGAIDSDDKVANNDNVEQVVNSVATTQGLECSEELDLSEPPAANAPSSLQSDTQIENAKSKGKIFFKKKSKCLNFF